MQVLSNQEAWAYYSKLLKDLLVVCQLTGIQQWPQLQEFLHSFAKQNPGSVARSAMHAAITGEAEPKTGTSWPHNIAQSCLVGYVMERSSCPHGAHLVAAYT